MSSFEDKPNFPRRTIVNDRLQNTTNEASGSNKKSNCTGLAAIAGSLNNENHNSNSNSSRNDYSSRASEQNQYIDRRHEQSDAVIDPRTGVLSLGSKSHQHPNQSPRDRSPGMYGDCLLMTVDIEESGDGPVSDRTVVDDNMDTLGTRQMCSSETNFQMTRSISNNSFGSSTEGSPTKLPGSPKPELLLGCGGSPSDQEDEEIEPEINSTEDFFDFIAELNRNQAEATRHIPTNQVGDSSSFMRQCDQNRPDEVGLQPPVLSINKVVQQAGGSWADPRWDQSLPKCCEPMSDAEVNSFIDYNNDDDDESVASSNLATSDVNAQRVRPNRRSAPQDSQLDSEYPKPTSSSSHRRSGGPILATPDLNEKGDGNTPQDIAAKIASLKLTQNSDKRAANRRQQLQSSGPLNQDGRRSRGKKFSKAPPELTGLFFKSKADHLLDGDSTPSRHNDSEEEVESYGRDFKETYSLRNTRNMTYIDSHCHIDFLFKRHSMGKDRRWADYNSKYFQYSPESFEGFVAIYCEPYAFKDFMSYPHLLREPGVNCVAAFGIHPHSAQYYNEDIENRLRRALEHPKCTALGEIGLDYSDRASGASESIQKKVFIRQLQLAKEFRKNLVLHCRDADQDFNQILRDHMPKDWVMHRHCFTENVRLLDELLRTFPNMYIGFTNLIAFSSAHEPREAARKMPLNRLLLETDAPYFLHPRVPKKLQYSHPSMAVYVAEKIAELKGCPLELVMKHARENTRTVYNI